MKEGKKIDVLEKLFLLAVIIDIIVLSTILIFIAGIFTICIFLGILMFAGETAILLYQAIKSIFTINLLTAMGFLGTAIAWGIMGIGLFIILQRLISVYPKTINRVKNFITLNHKTIHKKEIKCINVVEKRKIFISLLVSAIIFIGIAIISRNYQVVIEFIEINFDFENMEKFFIGG